MSEISRNSSRPYRGRFAPSPTGDLHMGSLVAAMASYLDARHQDGEWLVRIEDLDPPREVAGSATGILNTLEAFGFEWDGEIVYQSERDAAYIEALETLLESGHAFRCGCSRKEIAATSPRSGSEGPIYPGTCRNGVPRDREPRSVRLRVDRREVCFDDRLQGRQCQDIAREIGDFVILRADGYFAYQLAVVVDDAAAGVTDVVRGADLLASTPRQILLQERLGLPTPRYLHLPLLLDDQGHKLSKQASSSPVDHRCPINALFRAATLLRLDPPQDLATASVKEFWDWAIYNWNINKLEGLSKL